MDLPGRWTVKMGQERSHEEDKEIGIKARIQVAMWQEGIQEKQGTCHFSDLQTGLNG